MNNKQKNRNRAMPTGTITSFPVNNWFIRLRWLACAVSFLLIVLTIKVFHYLEPVTFLPLMGLAALIGISNIVYSYLLKHNRFTGYIDEFQVMSDLVILTLMLIFSGGIENPLSFAYLFHVIISGILFEKGKCYLVVGFCFMLQATMTLGELYGVLPHYTLHIFPHPHIGDSHHHLHASHDPVYAWSIMAIHLFIMILTAYFTTIIMDRLRREEKYSRQEHQRLERVLEVTGVGLLILNKELRPVWYNKPVEKWLEFPKNNSDTKSKIVSQWIENMKKNLEETLTGGALQEVELGRIDEEGQNRFFQVTLAPLTDEQGQVYQLVELIQDISEKKLLEEEMVHSAKMVILGTMAAGIAHEVGNPLASIATRLHLMNENHEPAFLTRSIGLLRKEIQRIEQIVYEISKFGRPRENLWEPCQVNQTIVESIEIIKYHKAAKSTRFQLDLDENLPPTVVVRDQLKQVFINLTLNALSSMSSGGTITVRSHFKKGYLVAEFSDSGEGIKAEDLEKVFQPFFTTKKTGSGLGLFIVNQIVLAHGGKIDVESKIGKGSKFSVYLPLRTPRQTKQIPRENH